MLQLSSFSFPAEILSPFTPLPQLLSNATNSIKANSQPSTTQDLSGPEAGRSTSKLHNHVDHHNHHHEDQGNVN